MSACATSAIIVPNKNDTDGDARKSARTRLRTTACPPTTTTTTTTAMN